MDSILLYQRSSLGEKGCIYPGDMQETAIWSLSHGGEMTLTFLQSLKMHLNGQRELAVYQQEYPDTK